MSDDDKMISGKVQLPKFNGERKDFVTWWMRFQAYAAVVGFTQSIQKTRDGDLPLLEAQTLDSSDAVRKKQEKALKSNRIAMANLTMAFTSEQLIGYYYKAITSGWPTGQAYKVVGALFNKYSPQDLVSKIELRREMNAVSMKRDDDP